MGQVRVGERPYRGRPRQPRPGGEIDEPPVHLAVKPPEGEDASELAAWAVLANLLLNLDEMITKG